MSFPYLRLMLVNSFTFFISILSFVKSVAPDVLPFPIFNSSMSRISEGFNLGDCPFMVVEHGNVLIKEFMGQPAALITCEKNYTLNGKPIVLCLDGDWKFDSDKLLPKCEKRCPPPPYLENGNIVLDKKLEDVYSPTGRYLQGTTVTYTCKEGYSLEPSSSYFRVCENEIWTGVDAFCKLTEEVTCSRPPSIENGYMQPSFPIEYSPITVGQEVLYHCLRGYKLVGSEKIKCTENGIWLPELPTCHKDIASYSTGECNVKQVLDPKIHSRIEISSMAGNVVELVCQASFQNLLAPCQSTKLYCKHGKWVGNYPECVEVHTCKIPPGVSEGMVIRHEPEITSYNSEGCPVVPINTQITYECVKGYILDGSPVITCQRNGCWEPHGFWPTCIRNKYNYFVELDNIKAILVSSATGIGVLGILLLACLIVACKKRRAIARAVSLPTTTTGTARHTPNVVNDHAVLLQHPDRLALIAFADGVQNSQNNSLPSYDEATRDRSTLIQVSRLQIQRPHWPNLTVCRTSGRNRGSPIIDSGHHVARHGSSVSHTPSMRSGGDSMGSTETVTISEGSTNVTLDTASSHSAVSQNPSCRGHCGSLASFDGCSVGNTEGIPLLEESELEEIQGGANDVENPIVSDNTSSKNSTHSAPMLSN